MTKYYYDKYTSKGQYGLVYVREQLNAGSNTIGGWTNYSVNPNTGVITNSGTNPGNVTFYQDPYVVRYLWNGTNLLQYTFRTKDNGSLDGVIVTFYTSGITRYIKDVFVERLIAEDETYPTNGRHSDNYWYVRVEKAVPTIFVRVDGNYKNYDDGFVKINGLWRRIDSVFVKINGLWRES